VAESVVVAQPVSSRTSTLPREPVLVTFSLTFVIDTSAKYHARAAPHLWSAHQRNGEQHREAPGAASIRL
jgi:hypothetical protein